MILWRIKQFITVLRCRAILQCPFCKGAGGARAGYYEPEWWECSSCWKYWEPLEDHGMKWFAGRLPILTWLRAKLCFRAGVGELIPLRVLLRCKLGIHYGWIPADPETEVCNACYQSRKRKTNAS